MGDFQPKLMTKTSGSGEGGSGSRGSRRKSSGRTNALYEHGKAKGHSSHSFSPFAEVSDPSELTFAPKIKGSKKQNDSKGSGAERIDRLYQAGSVIQSVVQSVNQSISWFVG